MQVRRDEVSALAWDRWCSIAAYIVGTPSKMVTLSRPMISRALPASNRGSSVRLPPAKIVAFRPQVRPKTWNSGRQPMVTSPGPAFSRVAAVSSALRVRFAWVSSAPLGRPVVPEVYRITAVVAAGLLRRRGRRGERGEQRAHTGLIDLEDLRARPGGALGCFHRRLVPGEQDLGPGIAEVVGDLAVLQHRVHRHHRGAGGERAVEGDREGGHVRQHDGDPVTGRYPQRRQQRRRAAGGVPQLRVGQHQVVLADQPAARRGRPPSLPAWNSDSPSRPPAGGTVSNATLLHHAPNRPGLSVPCRVSSGRSAPTCADASGEAVMDLHYSIGEARHRAGSDRDAASRRARAPDGSLLPQAGLPAADPRRY